MSRTPSWRLDPAVYPHRSVLQTRFQDLDPLGHLNNVAYAALFETARVRFNQSIGLQGWKGHRWLVANVEINYLAEGHFPDDVEIATGIGAIGTRSWHILSTAFQGDTAIATCSTVLVMSGDGGATELPAEFRAGLEKSKVTGLE